MRFCKAQPRDHLCMAAFEAIYMYATLDACWSKSSKTVPGHVTEVIFILQYSDMLGITNPFPPLGTFPKFQHLGMLQAKMVIMWSTVYGLWRREGAMLGW